MEKKLDDLMKLELKLWVSHLLRHYSSKTRSQKFGFDEMGAFWFPTSGEIFLANECNCSKGVFEPKSAGVTLSLIAASYLSFKHFDRDYAMKWGQYYRSLREYTTLNFQDRELQKITSFLG